MDKEKFILRPLEQIYHLESPPLNMPMLAGDWQCMNVLVNDKRIQSRLGYTSYRDFGDNVKILGIVPYIKRDGTKYTLILTGTDLGEIKTGASETFKFQTEMGNYDASVKTISADGLTITFKTGTTLQTDGVAAGDYFVMDGSPDHLSENSEVDSSWKEIASVDSETQITLSSAYEITNQDYTGVEKDGLIRKIYSVPTRERWQWAVVDDKFCFTNGNVDVQYFDTTGYSTALDSTNAKKARYCLSYAQRLLLADVEIAAQREPWSMMWSKQNDPTDWTDSTAGSIDFIKTDYKITGLGQVGNNVVIYKTESIVVGYRTGDATDPFTFPNERIGIGNIAPYSLVHFLGTNAFLSKENFYIMNGDQPEAIGDPIKYKFFDIVDKDELQHVWGVHLAPLNLVGWFANTNEGQLFFAYDYQDNSWTTIDFYHSIQAMGEA